MEIRCPYNACQCVFENAIELKTTLCPSCKQTITARSLLRHQEIDKQLAKHIAGGTAFTEERLLTSSLPPMVAILEEVRSLWNVGSIFRSADGAGFGHLFLTGITGCPPRKEIAKTSLGAEEHISWLYSASSLEVITVLRKLGYQIIALEKNENSADLKSMVAEKRIQAPLCLIVGNEVTGIYAETLEHCDLVCHLPMRGFKESLNVAVAFGIASYEISLPNHVIRQNMP
ncbi:MAG: hypothetical protein K2W82_04355 [Candidatus Obscuribacterales bacterium]|nr:hypothetical protein [Candidatus Obscuribacterales bacterium]